VTEGKTEIKMGSGREGKQKGKKEKYKEKKMKKGREYRNGGKEQREEINRRKLKASLVTGPVIRDKVKPVCTGISRDAFFSVSGNFTLSTSICWSHCASLEVRGF
jgi:hypothetical protein